MKTAKPRKSMPKLLHCSIQPKLAFSKDKEKASKSCHELFLNYFFFLSKSTDKGTTNSLIFCLSTTVQKIAARVLFRDHGTLEQSGFQRDCKVDAARALLWIISGFGSLLSVIVKLGQSS